MSAKVTLNLANPDGTSKAFELTEHDTFLLGRLGDCHLCLPNDEQVSRHHFMLEACPPQASLRYLGSMNGTHVKPETMPFRAQADTRANARFKREMDVIAKLRHPNIVRFLDSGPDEGTFFFVMENFDGGSLADVARSHGGTLPWDTHRPCLPLNFSVSALKISAFTPRSSLAPHHRHEENPAPLHSRKTANSSTAKCSRMPLETILSDGVTIKMFQCD